MAEALPPERHDIAFRRDQIVFILHIFSCIQFLGCFVIIFSAFIDFYGTTGVANHLRINFQAFQPVFPFQVFHRIGYQDFGSLCGSGSHFQPETLVFTAQFDRHQFHGRFRPELIQPCIKLFTGCRRNCCRGAGQNQNHRENKRECMFPFHNGASLIDPLTDGVAVPCRPGNI